MHTHSPTIEMAAVTEQTHFVSSGLLRACRSSQHCANEQDRCCSLSLTKPFAARLVLTMNAFHHASWDSQQEHL